MNRDGYEFLEVFNKIDERFIEEAGKEWVKKGRRMDIRSQALKAACALFCVGLGAVVLLQPQVKAAIARLANGIAAVWEVEEDLSPYTEVINEAQTKDDFTVTLNEVILSDNRIYVGASVETEHSDGFFDMREDITINGEKYELESIVSQSGEHEWGTLARDHVFTLILKDGVLPENITDMELHFLAYKDDEDVLDEEQAITFDFVFTVSREELEKDVVRVPFNETIPLESGGVIELTSLVITPVDSRIEGIVNGDASDDGMYYLMGYDNRNHAVAYFGEISGQGKICFETEIQLNALPPVNCEWLDLQMFVDREVDEEEWEAFDSDDDGEYFLEDDGKPINQVAVGEKFRIDVSSISGF